MENGSTKQSARPGGPLQRKLRGFGHAFRGLKVMLHDYNALIHLPAALVVVLLAAFLEVSRSEWLWLLWSIALMWIAETFNTAIEKAVDLYSPSRHPLAKQAKDLSAAGVLLSLFFAAVVGMIILGPKLWAAWKQTIE